MIISHCHKFIFIKTKKTAGTSIEYFLSKHCGEDDIVTPIYPHIEGHLPRNHDGFYNHISAEEVLRKVGESIWRAYFTFTVERNPWDKTLSYFHMINARANVVRTLDEYLHGSDFCSDYDLYMRQGCKDEIMVDKIIDFENLSSELGEIFEGLDIPYAGDLGIQAKSEYREDRRCYREVYSEAQAELVATAFSREIDLLGYSF
jgi:hypothetical protein